MASIGKEVKILDVSLDPSPVVTSRMVVTTVKVAEITKIWGDYVSTTWASVSNLTW